MPGGDQPYPSLIQLAKDFSDFRFILRFQIHHRPQVQWQTAASRPFQWYGIVQNKLDEIPIIPDPVLEDLVKRFGEALNEGMPVNSPIAVELGLVASLVRTIAVQRKHLAQMLQPIGEKLTGDAAPE